MSSIRNYIWLSECINFKNISAVLDRFDTPEAVYVATKEQLLDVLTPLEVQRILEKDFAKADKILSDCFEKEIRTMAICDSEYPDCLRNIDNPPLVLYYKGRLPDIENQVTINVIGTRKPTAYGQLVAKRLSCSLAKAGVVVVSGMAMGIDTIANQSAILEGKPTIAVLGCSVDVCYPASNRKLMDDIIAVGAVISEYPPTTEPFAYNFPQRNRIMSGLSKGVVVVEAAKQSGTLITSEYALEQGRDIFAVPGNIDNKNSQGCNELIKSGAKIVTCTNDILEEYSEQLKTIIVKKQEVRKQEVRKPKPKIKISLDENKAKPKLISKRQSMTDIESKIYDVIQDGAEFVDDIIAKSNISTAEVMSALTMLEIYGDVCKIDKRIKIKEN